MKSYKVVLENSLTTNFLEVKLMKDARYSLKLAYHIK